jgi:hypothetical protein
VADAVRVNFGDAATPPPAGFLRDSGKPFGLRTVTDQGTVAGSATYTYGWKRRTDNVPLDLSLNGRNRNTTLDPDIDVRLATIMHLQGNHITGGFSGTPVEGYWELQVPNGTYDVTVSAGDAVPSSTVANNEFHTLNVEGVNALNRFQSVGASTRPKPLAAWPTTASTPRSTRWSSNPYQRAPCCCSPRPSTR